TLLIAAPAIAFASWHVLPAATAPAAPIAVSFWIPRAEAPEAAAPRSGSGAGTGEDPVGRRLAVLEDATEGARPDVPHLHLSSMAVLPGQRGRGAGGAMLTAGLARAEELRLPVHLEASTPASRRLYVRYGFRDHGAPLELPGQGPVLRPRWRERAVP